MKYKVGSKAYIVESNRIIREVTIVKAMGGLYIIRFSDSGGGIQVKEHRLFATEDDARKSLPVVEKPKPNRYDLWD